MKNTPALPPGATLEQMKEALLERSVQDFQFRFSADGVTAAATLSALRGPEGRFHASGSVETYLLDAVNSLCANLDASFAEKLVVRDTTGRVRGLYERDREGRSYAQKHADSLGVAVPR